MIALWHCADTRSFRPLWMLEEMALPYLLHLLSAAVGLQGGPGPHTLDWWGRCTRRAGYRRAKLAQGKGFIPG